MGLSLSRIRKKVKKTGRRIGKEIKRTNPNLLINPTAALGTEAATQATTRVLEKIIPVPEFPEEVIDSTIPGGAPIEEASLSEFEDEEIERRKKKSKKSGAKSLQIPLGGVSGKNIGTGN